MSEPILEVELTPEVEQVPTEAEEIGVAPEGTGQEPVIVEEAIDITPQE